MGKGFKKTAAFLFFMLAGICIGTVVARLCQGISWLDWLSWGQEVGVSTASPMMLDLIIIKIAFGFILKINIAQILCVILAIVAFSKTCKSL